MANNTLELSPALKDFCSCVQLLIKVHKSNIISIGQPWAGYKIFCACLRCPYCLNKAFLKGFHDVFEWAASVSLFYFQSFSSDKLREIFNTLSIGEQITFKMSTNLIMKERKKKTTFPTKPCWLHSTQHLSLPHCCNRITWGVVATSSPLWLLNTRYSKAWGWIHDVKGLTGIKPCRGERRLQLSYYVVLRLQNFRHRSDWPFCARVQLWYGLLTDSKSGTWIGIRSVSLSFLWSDRVECDLLSAKNVVAS